MEECRVLHPKINTNGNGKENLKSEKDQKVGSIRGGTKRMRLSDITNIVISENPGRPDPQLQENPKNNSCPSTKEYIAQLLEENTVLLKALGERNKIIELSNAELQKLRLQNRQLAHANTQILLELNAGKDRLKALQHELGCKEAVLKLKNLELNEKEKLNNELCEKIGTTEELSKCVEVATDVSRFHSDIDKMACKQNRSLDKKKLTKELCENVRAELCNYEERSKIVDVATHASQSDSVSDNMACNPEKICTRGNHSLGSSSPVHAEEAKKKNDRRKSSRRRSSNLRSEPCELKDNLFEVLDAKNPSCSVISEHLDEDNPIQRESSAPSSSNISMKYGKVDTHEERSSSPGFHNQVSRRSSVGRPTRKAAEKVSSYKEMPINVKMRRPK